MKGLRLVARVVGLVMLSPFLIVAGLGWAVRFCVTEAMEWIAEAFP